MFNGLDLRDPGRVALLLEPGQLALRVGVGGIERQGFGQVGDRRLTVALRDVRPMEVRWRVPDEHT